LGGILPNFCSCFSPFLSSSPDQDDEDDDETAAAVTTIEANADSLQHPD
jgi:hypothetical protein